MSMEGTQDRRHLHEIGTRADDANHRPEPDGPFLIEQDDTPLSLLDAQGIDQLLQQ
jgi:hypothetical protein